MKPILLLAGVLGAGTAGAVALQHVDVDVHVRVPHVLVNVSIPEHPGPDSARVASLLAAMSATDPVTCEMIGDRVGNGWWGREDWGVGQLADARPEARAARDSLSGQVRDPGAIAALTAALPGDNACVRRTAATMLGRSTVSDDAIRRLLDDQSLRVREAALVAAGHAERPALRERTEALLRDRDEAVASM
ncbi:MAG: HEAT repeat domain-containing protein, partial [Gemmatimonadales bacterium]